MEIGHSQQSFYPTSSPIAVRSAPAHLWLRAPPSWRQNLHSCCGTRRRPCTSGGRLVTVEVGLRETLAESVLRPQVLVTCSSTPAALRLFGARDVGEVRCRPFAYVLPKQNEFMASAIARMRVFVGCLVAHMGRHELVACFAGRIDTGPWSRSLATSGTTTLISPCLRGSFPYCSRKVSFNDTLNFRNHDGLELAITERSPASYPPSPPPHPPFLCMRHPADSTTYVHGW